MRCIMCVLVTFALTVVSSCSKNDANIAAKKELSAKVVFFVGDVRVERDGTQSAATIDALLGKGSTLVTTKKSECNLLVGSDSYILVKENSRLLIEGILSENGSEKSSVDLLSGKLVVNPKRMLKNDEFRVKTPTSIAAVRGTKFVVSNEDGKTVKISVVEGKVEMKPRVAVLEETKDSTPVSREITKKIDDHAIIIEANQTGSIKVAAAEKLNKEIETVMKSAPAVQQNDQADKSVALPEIAAVIEKAVSKIDDVKIIKEDNVSTKSIEDVANHQKIIEGDRKRRELEAKSSAQLTIVSPVKEADVIINGKKVGRGTVNVRVEADALQQIEIQAKGFESYTEEITLKKDESKTIEVSLVRNKLRDRMDWTVRTGNVKSDLIFFNDSVISVTSAGVITSMSRAGVQLWRLPLNAAVDATPALADGRLYIVSKNENLYAVDAGTGKILWTEKAGGTLAFGSSPRVVDGMIITAMSNGRVKAISKEGKEKWSTDLKAGIYCTPAVSAGLIFIGADDQILYALDLKDGDIDWKGKLDGRVVSSAPVIHEGKVIVGTFKGSVTAFSVKKGKKEWSFKTGASVVSAPVVSAGKLYIGSKDQKVYAIDPANGKEMWSYKTNAPITAEVSFNDTTMFVLSGRTVYTFNKADHVLGWTYALPENGVSLIADNNEVYVGTAGGLSGLRIDLRDVVKK